MKASTASKANTAMAIAGSYRHCLLRAMTRRSGLAGQTMTNKLPEPSIIRAFRLRTKLMLMGLLLLVIPLLGYQYLLEMKSFLVEGQAAAQLLTAKGIAATLHNRQGLFEQLPDAPNQYVSLPSYPLNRAIRLDGFNDDWRNLVDNMRSFGTTTDSAVEHGFSLVLGTRNQYLYGYMIINDATPVYRHPGFLRLDNSDHLRIRFKDRQGQLKRLLMTMEGPGVTTSYYVDKSWLYAEQGQPENRVQGFIRASQNSYHLEFRVPLSMLDESRQLSVVVANVTDAETRQVNQLSGTFPESNSGQLSHIIMRSTELENMLTSLDQSDARIWIFDQHSRVRATVGNIHGNDLNDLASLDQPTESPTSAIAVISSLWKSFLDFVYRKVIGESPSEFRDYDPRLTQGRQDAIITQALSGKPGSQRRLSLDNKAEILTAVYPIYNRDSVVGAVVIEQSTQSILRIQRRSLQRVTSLTLLSLIAVVLVVALFATRLAFRIRRLRVETHEAIDHEGRLLTNQLTHEIRSGDEIGDLARSISAMLAKLHQYQGFIGTIPKTLRHEINNPLNTISTSLEHLSDDLSSNQQQSYLAGAQRGLAQINALVEKLAEAASLESALADDAREVIDFSQLLKQYLYYFKQNHDTRITSQIPAEPIWINVADYRMEQLIDKLLENALDFNLDDEPVEVSLIRDQQLCLLKITNKGATIRPEQFATLFTSMQSSRADQQHFGLGLYIAKLITSAHKGQISADNLPDNSGVCFTVTLPLTITQ
jgi:dedicated sortase system histidine kinase